MKNCHWFLCLFTVKVLEYVNLDCIYITMSLKNVYSFPVHRSIRLILLWNSSGKCSDVKERLTKCWNFRYDVCISSMFSKKILFAKESILHISDFYTFIVEAFVNIMEIVVEVVKELFKKINLTISWVLNNVMYEFFLCCVYFNWNFISVSFATVSKFELPTFAVYIKFLCQLSSLHSAWAFFFCIWRGL